MAPINNIILVFDYITVYNLNHFSDQLISVKYQPITQKLTVTAYDLNIISLNNLPTSSPMFVPGNPGSTHHGHHRGENHQWPVTPPGRLAGSHGHVKLQKISRNNGTVGGFSPPI